MRLAGKKQLAQQSTALTTMKATTFGISKLAATSKTARTGIRSPERIRSRTPSKLITPSGTLSAALLTTRNLKIAHSKLPPGFRLTFNDCLILLYVEQQRKMPYAQWPEELRLPKAVEKLRSRRYLLRGYWPTNYTITKAGYSLVKWIQSSLEHSATSTPKS